MVKPQDFTSRFFLIEIKKDYISLDVQVWRMGTIKSQQIQTEKT